MNILPLMQNNLKTLLNRLLGSKSQSRHPLLQEDKKRNLPDFNWKFDPVEEKILNILLREKQKGISVQLLNEILKVDNKPLEYQRQRRHLILKDLNNKLFFIFGIRECVQRVSKSADLRIKSYVLLSDIFSVEELIKILNK